MANGKVQFCEGENDKFIQVICLWQSKESNVLNFLLYVFKTFFVSDRKNVYRELSPIL